MDNRKIIVTFYIVGGMVVWFVLRSAFNYFHTMFYQIRRFPGIEYAREILPLAVALIAFAIVLKHPRVNVFLDEAVMELKKVTWPSRDDVVRSTTVVFGCILVASFILAIFDLIWGKVISSLLKG